jgi:hypothetical protein
MLGLNVAYLQPDHHTATCGAGWAPGHFEESRPEKEHHPPISRRAELAIDRQTQHIAIETLAPIEVCGAQQNPAAQDDRVPILARRPAVADAKASILICREW